MKKENSSVQVLGFAFVRQLPWFQVLIPREGRGRLVTVHEIVG
jgi:hypothetical protein